jgi:hypothetical protein
MMEYWDSGRPCAPSPVFHSSVCKVFFWRYATPLFTVTYEPCQKGD